MVDLTNEVDANWMARGRGELPTLSGPDSAAM